MSRLLAVLLLLLVVVVGALALLAAHAHPRAPTHTEQPVDLANLS